MLSRIQMVAAVEVVNRVERAGKLGWSSSCKHALTTCTVVSCALLVGLLLVGELSAQPATDSATLVRIAALREIQFLREWREAWAKSEQDRHPISGTYLGGTDNSRVIVNGKARFRRSRGRPVINATLSLPRSIALLREH